MVKKRKRKRSEVTSEGICILLQRAQFFNISNELTGLRQLTG